MKKLYPNYIPLFRVMDTKDAGGKAGGKKIADIGQPIYRLGGSGRQITSPFENAVVYAERMVSIADKIRVGGMIADAAKHYGGVGDIIEKVPPDIVAKSATLKALQEQLLNANVNLDAADLNSMITIFENVYRGSSKDNIIVLWRDGKQEMYQVDPDVYRALTNLDQQFQLPKVLDWIFGKPARLLRLATTGLRAGFSMITNPLRDTMTSVMQTRTEGFQGTLPGKIADNIAGIYWDLAGTESARLFKAGGGEMGQPLGIDRVFLQEAVHEMLAKTPRQKVMNWARHPVDSLRQLFSITELGPRLAEFVRVAKARGWKGEGHRMTFEQYLDAQMAAADVTVDFRQGGWLSMWLNRITAFHNANMQGPVQMVQAFKRKPAETTAKGILWLTLPTLGLWWANKDKDWYRDMSDFEKFGYWHIDVNGTVLRIPRPFEWGILFASIPEALIEWAYKQDPQYVKDVMGQSFQILTPPIVPSAVTPITETIFNWDTFRRRPVVSRGMQYLRPEDQSYTTTTETAKKLGQILGVSPASIEFLMAGYTGTMSTEIIRAGESALRSAGLLTKKGARPGELSDIPVVGRLFLRPNTTKVFDEFYSKVEALNQTHSSAKLHGTKMLPSEARQRVVFNSSVKRLKDLRERSRKVIDNVAISDAQKRTNLQLIQDKMVRVAKLALKQNEK